MSKEAKAVYDNGYVEVADKIRVFMITSEWPTPERPNSGPFIRQQVEFLRRAGVQVDVFRFQGARNPVNYLRAWRRVRSQLKESNYDLVHAQWGQSALLTLPRTRPLVVTFRGSDLEGIIGKRGRYTPWGWVLRMVSRMMGRLADQVIVVSEQMARHLPRRNYHVIPSGLDLDLFKPGPQAEARKKLGLPGDGRLILFAAAPENTRKRYALARAAVAELNPQFGAELIVASGAEHSEMPNYMSACDVLLLTSLHEGSPNVVKEALACNLPIVSVPVGDVRERIGHLESCVVCADDRPETLASGLAVVLGRDHRAEIRDAVGDLDENLIAQKVISVYRKAMSTT
jgi:glycosyltransferase involved in cell wall biosynthesis